MPQTTTPQTVNQRRAVTLRRECHDVAERLRSLADAIERIPAGWRANVANALCCIAHSGPFFAIACGKAAVQRTAPPQWGANHTDYWPFIDRLNADFAQRMTPDMVERWNTPAYPQLLTPPGGR